MTAIALALIGIIVFTAGVVVGIVLMWVLWHRPERNDAIVIRDVPDLHELRRQRIAKGRT